MKVKVAPVKNVARFGEALDAIFQRSAGEDGVVLVHGATGAGKTTALAYYASKHNAYYVEASPAWSMTSMLRAILGALGQEPRGRAADMERQIVDQLSITGRPLFVDEINYIFLPGQQTTLRMVETLHSIYDKSRMPIALVGMDRIDRRIKAQHPQFARRTTFLEFRDMDIEDLRTTADTLCEVRIGDDLLDALFSVCKGRMGYAVRGLAQAERRAKAHGWNEIGTERWGDREWALGF